LSIFFSKLSIFEKRVNIEHLLEYREPLDTL